MSRHRRPQLIHPYKGARPVSRRRHPTDRHSRLTPGTPTAAFAPLRVLFPLTGNERPPSPVQAPPVHPRPRASPPLQEYRVHVQVRTEDRSPDTFPPGRHQPEVAITHRGPQPAVAGDVPDVGGRCRQAQPLIRTYTTVVNTARSSHGAVPPPCGRAANDGSNRTDSSPSASGTRRSDESAPTTGTMPHEHQVT